MLIKFHYLLFGLASMALLYSCPHDRDTTTPQQVIKKYERLVFEMKADSIPQLFTSDAEIGHGDQNPVRGRDSIYIFLTSFKNIRVIENHDDIASVTTNNESAIVNGTYKQTVIVRGKDTVHVAGTFIANMVLDHKTWLISKMRTRSF